MLEVVVCAFSVSALGTGFDIFSNKLEYSELDVGVSTSIVIIFVWDSLHSSKLSFNADICYVSCLTEEVT